MNSISATPINSISHLMKSKSSNNKGSSVFKKPSGSMSAFGKSTISKQSFMK